MGEPITLLWTSGWDSTFRLLQATLDEGRTVRTTYLLDERLSRDMELESIARIREALIDRLGSADQLPPTELHDVRHYPMDPEIERIWSEAHRTVPTPRQFKYLANVAEHHGWSGVEMCVVASDPIARRVLDVTTPGPATIADPALARLFAPFRFPTIHLTKTEIAELARRQGYADLLAMAWFCARPIRRKPCGYCTPCRLAKDAGREHDFSPLGAARERYRRTKGLVATRIWYPIRDAARPA